MFYSPSTCPLQKRLYGATTTTTTTAAIIAIIAIATALFRLQDLAEDVHRELVDEEEHRILCVAEEPLGGDLAELDLVVLVLCEGREELEDNFLVLGGG